MWGGGKSWEGAKPQAAVILWRINRAGECGGGNVGGHRRLIFHSNESNNPTALDAWANTIDAALARL